MSGRDARLEAVTLALFGAEYYPGPVPKGALDNWASHERRARDFLAMFDAAHGYPVPERGGLLGVVEERSDPSEEEIGVVRQAIFGSDNQFRTSSRVAEAAIRALDEHRAKRGR